jgi:hypothetical protein
MKMKKVKYQPIKPLAFAIVCIGFLFQIGATRKVDPNNPPVGNTGAPDETTCQQSGCHNGGSFAGTVAISGLPDSVYADTTYSITVTQTSNATRGGFQLLCLTAQLKNCGTLTAATGVNIGTKTVNSRKYARQSQPKNLTGGAVSWTFPWKAPSTLLPDSITFYSVSLAANGNGKESGDNVLKTSRKVYMKPLSTATQDIQDISTVMQVKVHASNKTITLEKADDVIYDLRLADMNGSLLQSGKMDGSSYVMNTNNVSTGIYILQAYTKEHVYVKKIFIP